MIHKLRVEIVKGKDGVRVQTMIPCMYGLVELGWRILEMALMSRMMSFKLFYIFCTCSYGFVSQLWLSRNILIKIKFLEIQVFNTLL
jgi:hypothetical protein